MTEAEGLGLSRTRDLCTAVAVALAVLGSGAPSAAALGALDRGNVRNEALDDSWLIANLTWHGNEGTFDWGEDETSTIDPTPITSSDPTKVPPPQEFVTDPLPVGIQLNVSRLIQLDFFVTMRSGENHGNACSPITLHLTIELLVGDRRVAGAVDGQGAGSYPSIPTGYGLCRYRMPPEVGVLTQGERLRLRIVYLTTGENRQFGVLGDHHSQLRLPAYTQGEIFWRDPARAKDYAPADDGGKNAIWTILGGAGVAAAVLRMGSRRRLAACLIGLVLIASFGGCLRATNPPTGDAPATEGGQYNSVHVEPDAGLGAADNESGSIFGRVHDVAFVALPGAYVSLLRTRHFTTSDPHGQFQLMQVEPGDYVLRVDKAGFVSSEFKVPVLANKITRVEVALTTTQEYSDNVRPHRHDYWGDATRLVAFNGTIPEAASAFHLPPDEKRPGRNSVIPGTYEVQVVLDWDPQRLGYSQLGIKVYPNNDPNPTNASIYFPRGPRAPFHVLSNWEMTDSGHQLFSTWEFRPGGIPEHRVQKATGSPPGELHIEITLLKGLVPLEPPHPDHWNGATRLNLTEPVVWNQPNYRTPTEVAQNDAIFGGCWGAVALNKALPASFGGLYGIPVPPSRVVPTDTESLDVVMRLNHASRAETNGQVIGDITWNLRYKTGDQPLGDPTYKPGPTPQASDDGKTFTWTIPVDSATSDGIYNKKSAWRFHLSDSDPGETCKAIHYFGLTSNPLSMTVEVKASRSADEAPAGSA